MVYSNNLKLRLKQTIFPLIKSKSNETNERNLMSYGYCLSSLDCLQIEFMSDLNLRQ